MWGEQAVRQAPKRWAAYPALIDAYTGLGDAKGVGKALDSLKKLGPRSAVKARAGRSTATAAGARTPTRP